MKVSNINLEMLKEMTPEQKWEFVCGDIKDEGKSGQVAILLGCWPEGAIERAKAAAELYHAGRVEYIVASGGVKWEYKGEQISEADLMARVMIENGVPEDVILLEKEARKTVENMICSTLVINRTLQLPNVENVIIVTTVTHMQRSLALAKALLPRKFKISGYPSYPEVSVEEWISVKENQDILDICITLLKGLVDSGIIEDMDVEWKNNRKI